LLQEVKNCGCDEVLPIEGFHTLHGEETDDYEHWWNYVSKGNGVNSEGNLPHCAAVLVRLIVM
jgi:hypothetical protein